MGWKEKGKEGSGGKGREGRGEGVEGEEMGKEGKRRGKREGEWELRGGNSNPLTHVWLRG